MPKTRLYIAGPMRGLPYYNFPEFDKAEAELVACEYEVLSPAAADRARGIDVSHCHTGTEDIPGFRIRDAMLIDTAWICRYAEGIALLDGWEHSLGAAAEIALMTALGGESFPVSYWKMGALI
jgi:hypothetical protein